MRPLKLSMSAFGPFVGIEIIDFTCLGDNPLFLLNGPTGAGKTTILDAICFALYGKTTGDEREGNQMRCDMSDDQLLTEVSFDFSLSDQQYQIRRVPEQPRVKKNGDGFTLQKPEAQLYKIESDGSQTILVSSKVSSANEYIENLTGLDADQFRQVMVLPQGKFRQLLMADSKEREKIFSQLFQTHLYRKIEDKLKNQALAIKASVKEHENRIEGVLHNAEVDSIEALNHELSDLEGSHKKALAQKNSAHDHFLKVNGDLEKGKQIRGDFAKLETLVLQEEQLGKGQAGILKKKESLVMSDKASQVMPYISALKDRDTQLNKAMQQVSNAKHIEEQCNKQLASAQEQNLTVPKLEQVFEEDQIQLQIIIGFRPQIEELANFQSLLSKCNHELNSLIQQESQLEAKSKALKAEYSSLDAQIPIAQSQAEQELPMQQELGRLDSVIAMYNQWQTALTHCQETEGAMAKATQEGRTLRASYNTIEKQCQETQLQWHQGQAALLAQSLSLGKPCLVCGSEHHPNPAQSLQIIPSQEAVQDLLHQQSHANGLVEQVIERFKGLKQKHKEQMQLAQDLQTSLGQDGLLTLDVLTSQQQNTSQLLNQASQAKVALNNIRLNQQLSLKNQQEVQAQQQLLNNSLVNIKQECSSLEGKIQQTHKSIKGQYQDLPTLDEAIAALESKIQKDKNTLHNIKDQFQKAQQAQSVACANHVSAKSNFEQYLHEQKEAQSQVEKALEQGGIETIERAMEHLLSTDQCDALKDAIQQYEQQCITVKAQVEQLSQTLDKKAIPDLEALNTSVSEAQLLKQQAEDAYTQVHGRFNVLTHTQGQLHKAQQEGQSLEKEYAVVGTLSDVANGQTGKKISLQRFVLSVLLDDVLVAASQRLSLMSKGRYQLLRKEDRAKGNKASGLELEVEDAYTSKVRSVATLSGGESFMAALSMALGVSDVVQAYSGGIKLDTLFIDEGFGSLDQESLDLAIRTLVDLQASGRMVGVISHVSEMKEQIATRIDITKTSSGSTSSLVLP